MIIGFQWFSMATREILSNEEGIRRVRYRVLVIALPLILPYDITYSVGYTDIIV